MVEKRYFWLKLYDDFFTSKRIKKLRTIAGGDTYTIIYLKMQLKALKTDGYLYFDGVMSDFADELALDIDENPDDVKVTINYLLSVGLLETNDGEQYKLPFLDRCIGSESASTQRSRDCRLRKRQQETLQCNDSATDLQQVCNAEIEKEIEIEKEKSKEHYTADAEKVLALYRQHCPSLPDVRILNEKRKKSVHALLQTFSVEDVIEGFKKAEESDFLKGKRGDWKADFEFLVNKNNMTKVLEGKYDNKRWRSSGNDDLEAWAHGQN